MLIKKMLSAKCKNTKNLSQNAHKFNKFQCESIVVLTKQSEQHKILGKKIENDYLFNFFASNRQLYVLKSLAVYVK